MTALDLEWYHGLPPEQQLELRRWFDKHGLHYPVLVELEPAAGRVMVTRIKIGSGLLEEFQTSVKLGPDLPACLRHEVGAILLSSQQFEVVRFCAIECSLQRSGEESVAWMLNAWYRAQTWPGQRLDLDLVLRLGAAVEPRENADGLRRFNVYITGNPPVDLPDWQEVPALLAAVIDQATPEVDPDAWFKAFEEVHPFIDGNGRTGVILFNWLRGTLGRPAWPTNWFSDPRRVPGYGA